jgi:hypothetical protein
MPIASFRQDTSSSSLIGLVRNANALSLSPSLHRDRAVCREHNDWQHRVTLLDFLKQAHSVHLVHLEIGDDRRGCERARL